MHALKLHLFLYLKDLPLGYKLYEGKDCVNLAFWGITKIKNSALHVVSAELIFVERINKVLEKIIILKGNIISGLSSDTFWGS